MPGEVQRVHLATLVHLTREWLEHVARSGVCPHLSREALGELLATVDEAQNVEGLWSWLDRRLRELGSAA